MVIMKYFIRKSNRKIKAAFGSAFFMVSAFAMFSPQMVFAKTGGGEIPDTVLTARYVFENLHNSALEILPVTTRLDMLDYWDVDSVYNALNAMEGLSRLEEVKSDYLKVSVTPVSNLEIKILPDKKSKIVMTVYTVGDDVQAQDSQIKFYDESLQEIPSEKYFEMPRVRDFFDIPKGSATKMKEIEDMIPFPTIAFSAFPGSNNLQARLTVEKYINEDDWNIAKLFVKPYITYIWEKGKLKIEKQKNK